MSADYCTCSTCGFQWVRYQHGGHSCVERLQKKVADLEAQLSARTEARRIREDEARDCLAIARTYAAPFVSPTAKEIVNALERRVVMHTDQTLPSPPRESQP